MSISGTPSGADLAGGSAQVSFGRFQLRPHERQLLADGQQAKLSSRAFDVLCALVERQERFVGKDELLGLVWPRLVVEENNLEVHVSSLRKLLGKEAIATVNGRGYRFALEIEATPPADSAPHNIPFDSTRFVGRADALLACEQLLADTRLLTLVGIGGSGKTRIALKLALRALPVFKDGVWIVDLAPIQESDRVDLAVAEAIQLSPSIEIPLRQHIASHVGHRHMLLVLDNCEHVVSALAETVIALLARCANLKIVATSRQTLNVAGERIVRVPPMQLPAEGSGDAQVVAESVQLFLDRAREVQPSLPWDPETALLVGDLCRRLDGLPLAIELAAAKLRMLTVRELSNLLNERLRLLTGHARTPARQRTLQTVLEWSYERLTEREQRLFRTLSVFAGGWTLSSAIRMSEQGPDEVNVLDMLGSLIDKGLVSMIASLDGARYTMLETVREHAQDLLAKESEEAAAGAHERHLAMMLELVETELSRVGPARAAWLRRMDLERENLLAAHRWCGSVQQDFHMVGLRLVASSADYWIARGLIGLGLRLGREALARPGARQQGLLRCSALNATGRMASFMGRFDEARTYVDEYLRTSREIGSERDLVSALINLAHISDGEGDTRSAFDHLHAALSRARAAHLDRLASNALAGLAELYRVAGALDKAHALYEESAAIRTRMGDVDVPGLLNRATIALCRNEEQRAHALACEALPFIREMGDRSLVHQLLDVVTAMATSCGKWNTAARFYGAAEELGAQMGSLPRERVDQAYLLPALLKTRAALGDSSFHALQLTGRQLEFEAALSEVEAWLKDRGNTVRS